MIRAALFDWAREHHELFAGIVNAARLPQAPPWVSWGALSAALGVIGFLWTQYQGYIEWRTNVATTLVKIESESRRIDQSITTLHNIEDSRHVNENRELSELGHRLDLQRDDIRSIQMAIGQHIDKGGNGR